MPGHGHGPEDGNFSVLKDPSPVRQGPTRGRICIISYKHMWPDLSHDDRVCAFQRFNVYCIVAALGWPAAWASSTAVTDFVLPPGVVLPQTEQPRQRNRRKQREPAAAAPAPPPPAQPSKGNATHADKGITQWSWKKRKTVCSDYQFLHLGLEPNGSLFTFRPFCLHEAMCMLNTGRLAYWLPNFT